MTLPVEVVVTAMTHQGRVRERNEDTVGVGSWMRSVPMEDPEQFRHPIGPPLPCVLADGMGGHAAGDEASRIAIFHLTQTLADAADEATLAASITGAHMAILQAMDQDPSCEGMGTTVVGLLIRPEGILRFNLGDSRLYRVRDGFVRQISTDDVPDSGWRPYDSDVPARSGILTQCLGGFRTSRLPQPHLGVEPLRSGWLYLLCSDGLTDLVPYSCMAEILTDKTDDEEKVRALVMAALENGGTDNVSVMLVRIGSSTSAGARR